MPTKREIRYTVITLCLVLGALGASIAHVAMWVARHPHAGWTFYAANTLFLFFIVSLCYGNILYHLTRWGYYRRLSARKKTRRAVVHAGASPALSVLIPSYKEEVRTVEQTVLSAALQGYPTKTITLLLDDPVNDNPADQQAIQRTQEAIERIHRTMHAQHKRYIKTYNRAWQRLHGKRPNLAAENRRLGESYRSLAQWFKRQAKQYAANDHTDALFVQKVYTEPAALYAAMARRKRTLDTEQLLQHYASLRDLFDVRLSVFQRKAYARLSHEPNKAMNINSYISLMGGTFDKTLHATADDARITFRIPDADYIITLDADSIISHGYARTLIDIMEAPGNERLAVAQTPYSSISGTPVAFERTAGATTDIQYIIHQGFTAFGATFWVGANALLRKRALEDIAGPIPGQPLVRQYIQDRTVIEDTESSIDLVKKGWSLHNHPERLAFSATPTDYGSLIIQRRRWANGGLIILPKLLGYLLRPSLKKIPEGFMRIHYLSSIALVNLSLVIMLLIPLPSVGFSIWVPLTAVPYFYLYYRDLRLLGYGFTDWLRVYALNLLLIPVNLGGVFKSIQQMITRKKIPFGRTPKVASRTAAPALYYILPYSAAGYCAYMTASDILTGQYVYAALISINLVFLSYALVGMVGIKAAGTDIRAAAQQRWRAVRKLIAATLPKRQSQEEA